MGYIADSIRLTPKPPKAKMYMYVLGTEYSKNGNNCFQSDWRIAMNEAEARIEHTDMIYALYGPAIIIMGTVCGLVPLDDITKVYTSHQ